MDSARTLVVGIPAFNEETTIQEVIQSIPRSMEGIKEVRIVVVDDGSTDATSSRAREAGVDRVISHSRNEGLGRTFRTLLDHSLRMGADIIVTMDADGQFNGTDIPRLIAPILNGKAGVVTCTRFRRSENYKGIPRIKRLGNRLFTAIVSYLSGQQLTDTQCGFRAYARTSALHVDVQARFTYTQEVLLNLAYKGFKIVEVDCDVKPQRVGKSKLVSSWYGYGLRAIVIILRTILNHHPLKFFGVLGIVLVLFGSAFIAYGLYLFLYAALDLFTWRVYLGFALMGMGGMMMVLALLADLYDRQRLVLEEIRFRLRAQELERETKE